MTSSGLSRCGIWQVNTPFPIEAWQKHVPAFEKVRLAHDLRHSYGSDKLDQGCNIYDVQRWMGHSSIQVTIDSHGHPVTDRGQEAAIATDAFLFAKKAAAD